MAGRAAKKQKQRTHFNRAKARQWGPIELGDTRSLSPLALMTLRRRAVRAVVLLEYDAAAVATLFGVNARTIQNWVRDFQQRGEEALQLPSTRGRKATHPLSDEQQAEVVDTLRNHTPESCGLGSSQLWTRKLVADMIEERYGVSRSLCRVGVWLNEWGLSYKRPSKRAAECDSEAVREWVQERFPAIRERAEREGAVIYWGDQSGVSSREAVGRTWARVGERVEIERVARRFRCNLMAAISDEGDLRFTVFDGNFDKDRMLDFVQRFVDDGGPKKFLILDNLSAHKAAPVRDWVAENADKIELFFLPAYSPHLNPAEVLNQDIKQNIRSIGPGNDQGELMKRVRSFLFGKQRQPEVVVNYFGEPSIAYACPW